MADDELVNLTEVLDRWKAEAELADALGDLAPLDADRWVSLAEAEELAGVSRSTLRAWYRSGRIPSRLVPGPHGMQRLVPAHLVTARGRRPARRGRQDMSAAGEAPATRGAGRSDATGGEAARLAELAVRQAVERAERAEARAERLEAELKAAIERAASAEAELRLRRKAERD